MYVFDIGCASSIMRSCCEECGVFRARAELSEAEEGSRFRRSGFWFRCWFDGFGERDLVGVL